MHNNLLLDAELIQRKLARMAYEIWERYSEEKTLYLLPIEQSGRAIAESLAQQLRSFSPLEVKIVPLTVDKKVPLAPAALPEGTVLDGRSAVVIDDVANSGKTLFYALKPLLSFDLKSLAIAVLVDRRHKSFPIRPDVVGHAFATTLQDHIEVSTEGGIPVAAYLRQ